MKHHTSNYMRGKGLTGKQYHKQMLVQAMRKRKQDINLDKISEFIAGVLLIIFALVAGAFCLIALTPTN